jgi:hypothetical protein
VNHLNYYPEAIIVFLILVDFDEIAWRGLITKSDKKPPHPLRFHKEKVQW